MRNEDPNERLLGDVLGEARLDLETSRSAAIGAFRRKKTVRRARVAVAMFGVLVGIASIPLLKRGEAEVLGEQLAEVKGEPSGGAANMRRTEATEITDEELLGLFPPGTCVIAEVNGEKRLVFLTREARERYGAQL
ncbi:MAG TPA: hypothetical protein VEH27_09945 [Methylomirabilota bacterium]|nr:hypothetical protein [Methylomirabilota bacterium]